MATLEIVFRAGAGSPRTFTVGNDTGGTMRIGAIGSGGAGGTGTVFIGGGGKGGSYAERSAQAVSAGDVLTLNIAPPAPTTAGSVSTVVRSGVTLVSARGGGVGGNGGAVNTGTPSTAFVGTFVGDFERAGGNGVGGYGGGGAGTLENGGLSAGTNIAAIGGQKFGGNGAANETPSVVGGGAGKGTSTLSPTNRGGAAGLVVLAYSTGVGSISHTSQFNRLATLSRLGLASITHTSIFDRLVTVRRNFTATITHLNRTLKTIKLFRLVSITHVARQTVKKVRLRRIATIIHTPFLRKAIRFLRIASIVHTARFQRLVTLRRRFTATIQHRARQLMKLEGRLIPREGGGGVIIQTFRNLFLFDD